MGPKGFFEMACKKGGLFALTVSVFLENVIIVDEDVNIFSHEDVFRAMTTRFQADKDITVIPGMPGLPADPTQNQACSNKTRKPGITSKAVFDLTVPFKIKKCLRGHFMMTKKLLNINEMDRSEE